MKETPLARLQNGDEHPKTFSKTQAQKIDAKIEPHGKCMYHVPQVQLLINPVKGAFTVWLIYKVIKTTRIYTTLASSKRQTDDPSLL